MKTLSSPSLLRASIGVAMAAVLALLINPFTNIFFGRTLNSPGYYAVVIVLSAATIVFGMLQVLGRVLVLRQNSNEQQIPPVLLESDIYGEKLAIHKLVSDIVQLAYPDLVSALHRYSDRQQESMSNFFGKITDELIEITHQNQLMLSQDVRNQQLEDVRNQELKNLAQALEANAQYLRAIAQQQQILLKERDVRTQQQSYPIKVTMEIDGVPITIETSDVEKAMDIASVIKQYTQAASSLSSEKKRQPSIFVKENTEPYKTESNPE